MFARSHGNQNFPGGSDSKASAYNVGDLGSVPGSGRSPAEENDYPLPLQYSFLENSMDRETWRATDSPWGHRELDTTEQLTLSLFTSNCMFGLCVCFLV